MHFKKKDAFASRTSQFCNVNTQPIASKPGSKDFVLWYGVHTVKSEWRRCDEVKDEVVQPHPPFLPSSVPAHREQLWATVGRGVINVGCS